MGLECCDRSDGEVDILPPAGHNRISWQSGMRMVPESLEIGEEGLSHLTFGEWLSCDWVSDELILHARSILAVDHVRVSGPETTLARGTDAPGEASVQEHLKAEFLLEHWSPSHEGLRLNLCNLT